MAWWNNAKYVWRYGDFGDRVMIIGSLVILALALDLLALASFTVVTIVQAFPH